MIDVIKEFQKRHTNSKPIIVADDAKLSQENMLLLKAESYQHIVRALLANAPKAFIESITSRLKK
ncbi:MAG: hypothetical protein JXA94_06545 [Parachlamydiales bacterium]|nr:hypothetical protein [Parachlamydiales bacterium]